MKFIFLGVATKSLFDLNICLSTQLKINDEGFKFNKIVVINTSH